MRAGVEPVQQVLAARDDLEGARPGEVDVGHRGPAQLGSLDDGAAQGGVEPVGGAVDGVTLGHAGSPPHPQPARREVEAGLLEGRDDRVAGAEQLAAVGLLDGDAAEAAVAARRRPGRVGRRREQAGVVGCR